MPLPHRQTAPGGAGFELFAVAWVALPHALHRKSLAGRGKGKAAHHRDGLLASHVQAQNGVAVLLVLEYEVFYRADKLQLVVGTKRFVHGVSLLFISLSLQNRF